MKNLEKYTSNDLFLHDAAKEYLKTIGKSAYEWDTHLWAGFCNWLFSERRFKYEIIYVAAGNPYVQTFYVDATSEEEATLKLHKSISSVSRIISVENFGSSSNFSPAQEPVRCWRKVMVSPSQNI